eukprot:Skav207350  [mRNA]  locus=scaffold426:139583:150911:- [translate_table: standard]
MVGQSGPSGPSGGPSAGPSAAPVEGVAHPMSRRFPRSFVAFKIGPASCQGMQPQMLFWIFLAYGYMLFTAANFLSDGSELLLFIPQAQWITQLHPWLAMSPTCHKCQRRSAFQVPVYLNILDTLKPRNQIFQHRRGMRRLRRFAASSASKFVSGLCTMGGLPSRFVPNSKGQTRNKCFQNKDVAMARRVDAKRFQVAGVDPRSPAGRWNLDQQASDAAADAPFIFAVGLRGICRGDELFEVNGWCSHSDMRQELVVSRAVRLLFRPGRMDAIHARSPTLGHVSVQIDNTDPEPEKEKAVGSAEHRRLSDFSEEAQTVDEDALSEASDLSFYSMSSSLSSSSQCSRNQQSSGRSCPSTDWEFQGYQCHDGQMFPPFTRSISSGPVHSLDLFAI